MYKISFATVSDLFVKIVYYVFVKCVDDYENGINVYRSECLYFKYLTN